MKTQSTPSIVFRSTPLFLFLLLGVLFAAVPAFSAPPSTRRVSEEKDAKIIARIDSLRDLLPSSVRSRYNFGWATARIEGLDKIEYFAHSGISSPEDVAEVEAEEVTWMSMPREAHERRFRVYCVNRENRINGDDCWERHVDTESKILEDMASRLPDTNTTGRVLLYTDLPPCASCTRVIHEFCFTYPNIRMDVLYTGR